MLAGNPVLIVAVELECVERSVIGLSVLLKTETRAGRRAGIGRNCHRDTRRRWRASRTDGDGSAAGGGSVAVAARTVLNACERAHAKPITAAAGRQGDRRGGVRDNAEHAGA